MKTYKVRIKKKENSQEMAYGGQKNYTLDLNSEYFPNPISGNGPLNNFIKEVPREIASAELERGESVVGDFTGNGNLNQMKVGGKRHYAGGTPVLLPDDAFIFSDTGALKMKGSELTAFGKSHKSNKKFTPAQVAKQYDLNKYQAVLDDPNSDDLSRKTANYMIANYQKKLSQLSLVQEAKKGFENGIPDLAIPYLQTMQDITMADNSEFNQSDEFKMGGALNKFVGGGPGDVDPYTGDKRNTKNPKTGIKSNVWNKSKYSKQEWEDIKSEFGYTGPDDNKAFQSFLFNNHPDIVNELHSNDKGYGIPSGSKKMIDGLLGVRWDGIVDKIREKRIVPQLQRATPRGNIKLAPDVPKFDINIPKLNIQPPVPANIPHAGDFNPGSNSPGSFDYMTPDKLNFMGALKNRGNIKKYMPWEAPVDATTVDPTFYDPSRELASNAEQMNTQMMYNSQFAGPQSLGARNSAVAGNAATNAANIMAKYDAQNVGVSNQFAGVNADIMNRLMDAKSQRATRLYDKTTITNQQYDNAVAEADNQIIKSGINAWNNRSNLSMLNDTNPYYNVDPTSGRIVFKKGRNAPGGTHPQGNSAPDFQAFYDEGLRQGMDDEYAKRYAYDMLKNNKATYTDKNNDGYWESVKATTNGYNGITGPR